MREAYNDIADWQYAALPGVFAPDVDAFTAVVKTESDLEKNAYKN